MSIAIPIWLSIVGLAMTGLFMCCLIGLIYCVCVHMNRKYIRPRDAATHPRPKGFEPLNTSRNEPTPFHPFANIDKFNEETQKIQEKLEDWLQTETTRPNVQFTDENLDLEDEGGPGKHKMWGIDSAGFTNFIAYWHTSYDYKRFREEIANLPNYKVTVRGLDVQFIWLKAPNGKNEDPNKTQAMVFVHGWPSTFCVFLRVAYRMQRVMPNVDLILPSVPGSVWSETDLTAPTIGAEQVAIMYTELMSVHLGYTRWTVQGTGWGALVSKYMGVYSKPQDGLVGVHDTLAPCPGPLIQIIAAQLGQCWWNCVNPYPEDREKALLGPKLSFFWWMAGYFHEQSTRPNTLAQTLWASPLAFAAWAYEKFISWCDTTDRPFGDLEQSTIIGGECTFDDVIQTLLLYWLSNSLMGSVRYYRINTKPTIDAFTLRYPNTIVYGHSAFKYALMPFPETWIEAQSNNPAFFRRHDKGGHYIGYEHPELLATDLVDFLHFVDEQSA